MIKIKKIKERFWGTSKENPIFDIELQIDKKINEKLLFELKKIKKSITKNKK